MVSCSTVNILHIRVSDEDEQWTNLLKCDVTTIAQNHLISTVNQAQQFLDFYFGSQITYGNHIDLQKPSITAHSSLPTDLRKPQGFVDQASDSSHS